jgi:hypothetical protein
MSQLQPIHFEAGDVDITLTPPNSLLSISQALLDNQPFPDNAFQDEAIPLEAIKATANREINLDNVKFSAGGSLFSGFGVYRSSRKLFDALKAEGLDEPMVSRLDFPDLDTKNIFALRWGYDAHGAINGAVALGLPGQPRVSFGASGRREGLYALLRLMDRNAKALDAIGETLNSWKMPRQISAPGDLKPSTWVIAETDGEIRLTLGLEYGYNYSWVRESLTLGGLTGDFGLKIEMGIKAQLGFNASGRYAVVLGRESDREALRLQIFKLRSQGWSFAFDASVSAKVEQSLIPDNFDDFIKGVFNVNGHQALQDILRDFDKWTDPSKKLKDLLGAELVDYAKKMVREVTGFDPDTDIDKAIEMLRKPLEQWRSLPHEVASSLYELLRKKAPLDDLREFLQRVIDLTDPNELAGEITERLREVAFFETPVGQWITATAEEGILSLLANVSEERKRLADIAERTLSLLDGSEVEQTLRKLQAWVEEKLGLDKIIAVVDDAGFEKMDAWLKRRLSDFLGKSLVFAELEKIKGAINHLRDKAEEFYAKGFNALTEKYQAEFHYSFQKTTTRSALIDATFDFDADPVNAAKFLKRAVSGDFTEILAKELSGVKLNKGVLTHEIKRRTHIEVSLPYFKSALDHINESLAEGEAVDSAEGRLWVFNLKAFDTVSKKQSLSNLSVAMQLTKGAGVRQFGAGDSNYNYTLRLVRSEARREYMENKLQVLADQYLKSEFEGDGRESLPRYLTALDEALDDKGVPGDGRFGNVLIRLDVSLPSQVLAAWKKVPAEEKDPVYMAMSRRVQEFLRRFIPLCYLQEPDKYKELVAVYPLLAYCALPPINKAGLTAGGQLRFSEDEVYELDFRNEDLRNKVLFEQRCITKLQNEILPRIQKELGGTSTQVNYEPTPSNIEKILSLRPGGADSLAEGNFNSLMFTEKRLIDEIHKAGRQLREHLDAQDFETAVKAFADFGATITDAFNDKIGGTIYKGSTLRPLGPMLFIEVAKVFDETLVGELHPSAMLELSVLKQRPTFKLEDYLKNKMPPDSEVALRQRIINVGTPLLL